MGFVSLPPTAINAAAMVLHKGIRNRDRKNVIEGQVIQHRMLHFSSGLGCWYFEVVIVTAGRGVVGFYDVDFEADSARALGVGDDAHSWGISGFSASGATHAKEVEEGEKKKEEDGEKKKDTAEGKGSTLPPLRGGSKHHNGKTENFGLVWVMCILIDCFFDHSFIHESGLLFISSCKGVATAAMYGMIWLMLCLYGLWRRH